MSTAKKAAGSGGGGTGGGSKGGAKGAARERLKEQRRRQAEQERRRTRMFQVTIALAVVVALALVGVAVLYNQNSGSGGSAAIPEGATGQSGGIAFGPKSAPTLDVYEDFQCPVCAQLEAQSGTAITQMARSKDVRVVYHPLSFLGPESVRAANAAGCAADEGKFLDLHRVMFANQPEEHTGGYTTDQLISFGKKAGIDSSSYAQCVRDGTYDGWVSRVDRQGGLDNVTATPTLKVNGKELPRDQYTTAGIKQAVQAAS